MTITNHESSISSAARSLQLEGLDRTTISVGRADRPLESVKSTDLRLALTIGSHAIVRDFIDNSIAVGLPGPVGRIDRMSFVEGIRDRYVVSLGATSSGTLASDEGRDTRSATGANKTYSRSAGYNIDVSVDPESFKGVYGARLHHGVLAIYSNGMYEQLGKFENLLDERVHSTLARQFRSDPAKFFEAGVIHNHATSNHLFDRSDPTKLVLDGKLDIDEYLARANYVFTPFDTKDVPQKIIEARNSGAIRFMEFWETGRFGW